MQLSASQRFGLVPARHRKCSHPYLQGFLVHPHVELPSEIWKTQRKSSTSSANVAELSVTVIFLSLSAIPLVLALLTSNHCPSRASFSVPPKSSWLSWLCGHPSCCKKEPVAAVGFPNKDSPLPAAPTMLLLTSWTGPVRHIENSYYGSQAACETINGQMDLPALNPVWHCGAAGSKSWLAAVMARVIPPVASALHPPWSQFRLQRGQTFNSHVILVFVLVDTLLAMLTPISCWNVSQVALSNICSSWLWWLWRPEILHHVSSPALLQPSTVSRSLQSAFLWPYFQQFADQRSHQSAGSCRTECP